MMGLGSGEGTLTGVSKVLEVIRNRFQLIAFIFLVITIAGVYLAIKLEGQIRLIVLPAVFFLLLLIFVVAALVVLIQQKTSDVSKKVDQICGDWWQFVLGGAENAISYIRISVIDGRLALTAQAFDGPGAKMPGPEGRASATWRTVVSVLDDDLKLFYMWSGKDKNRKLVAVQGFGLFEFAEEPDGAPSQTGDGYFTAGDLNNLTKESLKQVTLRRLDDKEKQEFAKGDKAKVALAALEKG